MTRKLAEDLTTGSAGRSRRPYKAPHLLHLGSVRELTLGMTGNNSEGGSTFIRVQGKGKA